MFCYSTTVLKLMFFLDCGSMSSRTSQKMGEDLASESDLLSMINEVGLLTYDFY